MSLFIDHSAFNNDILKYSAPKQNQSGGKSVNLYNRDTNKYLQISTPLILTWGVSDYEGNQKYDMALQFPSDEYLSGAKKEFDKIKNVTFSSTISQAVKESDLVILHTEWNDFKSINFKKLSKSKNVKIYDMRNIFSPDKIKSQGFKYFSIGR